MQEVAPEAQIDAESSTGSSKMGFTVHRLYRRQTHRPSVALAPIDDFDPALLEAMEGVKECHRIVSSYKLANRNFKPTGTIIKIGQVEIGGSKVFSMGGPCSIENEKQIEESAAIVAKARRSGDSRRGPSNRAVLRTVFKALVSRACKSFGGRRRPPRTAWSSAK